MARRELRTTTVCGWCSRRHAQTARSEYSSRPPRRPLVPVLVWARLNRSRTTTIDRSRPPMASSSTFHFAPRSRYKAAPRRSGTSANRPPFFLTASKPVTLQLGAPRYRLAFGLRVGQVSPAFTTAGAGRGSAPAPNGARRRHGGSAHSPVARSRGRNAAPPVTPGAPDTGLAGTEGILDRDNLGGVGRVPLPGRHSAGQTRAALHRSGALLAEVQSRDRAVDRGADRGQRVRLVRPNGDRSRVGRRCDADPHRFRSAPISS